MSEFGDDSYEPFIAAEGWREETKIRFVPESAVAEAVAAERLQIAREILAQRVPCKEHPMPLPKPSCWQCGRNGAFHRAALIAAGRFGPEWATP